MQAEPTARRYDRRSLVAHRVLAVLLSIAFVTLVGSIVLTLMKRAFDGEPKATVSGFTVVSDNAVAVRFDVRKKPGGRAYCIVRARGRDGSEVGRDVAEVDSTGSPGKEVRTEFELATTTKAVTGEVAGCSSKPISKRVDPNHH